MTPRRGFTILEVLLALAVTALVVAALSPALTGALRAQGQARRLIDEAAGQRAALAQWREDLLAALPPTGSVAVPFALTRGGMVAGSGTADSSGSQLSFLTAAPAPFHPDRVTSRPDTGQAIVTWALAPSADGVGLAWTRARQTDLLATGTIPAATPEVLLDHLASLDIAVVGSDGLPADTYSSADHDDDLPTQVVLTWAFLGRDGQPGPSRRLTLALPSVTTVSEAAP